MSEANEIAWDNGTYARLVPSEGTQQKIASLMDMINVENAISAKSLHTTVVYSKVSCDSIKNIPVSLPLKAHGVGFELFPNADGGTPCLVLKIESEELRDLHEECIREHGAKHAYPEFSPHITLSYDYTVGYLPNESLVVYFDDLHFDQYIVEPLNTNWSAEKDK